MKDETLRSPWVQVETQVQTTLPKAWDSWTQPSAITQWNYASEEWHCPKATNELSPGGRFNWRMEAKDGSIGFDFSGTYDQIAPLESIAYTLDDGRSARVRFVESGEGVTVSHAFEAEATNSIEMQKMGWQAILDNFKRYVEASS